MKFRPNNVFQFLLIVWFILFTCQLVLAASPLPTQKTSGDKDRSISADEDALMERLKNEDVESIMASLSDEQVRRLLLLELQQQAEQQAADAAEQERVGGLAGFIFAQKDIQVRRQIGQAFIGKNTKAVYVYFFNIHFLFFVMQSQNTQSFGFLQ